MLDTFQALSWQFKVLVGEGLLSMVIACLLIERNYTYKNGISRLNLLMPVWDLAVIALFLTGGAHLSWQHAAYLALFVWAIVRSTKRLFKKDEVKHKAVNSKLNGGVVFFLVVLTTCQLLLLING